MKTFFIPESCGVFAQHLVHLIVLVGGDEEVRVAVLAGEIRGAGIRADQDGAAVGHRLHDRLEDVGEDRPDHEVDLVAIDERLHLGDGHVGLEFVVLDQDLDIAPAQLAAELLDGELKAVAELLAEHRGRARERGDHADLELFLRLRRRCKNGERRGSGERAKQSLHDGLSLALRRITFRRSALCVGKASE